MPKWLKKIGEGLKWVANNPDKVIGLVGVAKTIKKK
jgi:hypothetical protein